jgi:thiol-disulfide isomerase/thioredoxin
VALPILLRAGLVAVPLLLVLGGCTGDSDVESGGGQGFVSGDGSALVIDKADRAVAPELSGETLAGDELSTSDLSGDVIVLNLWASWCGPCRAEAPALRQVSSDAARDGVSFVGINTRDQDAAALAFEKNYDIPYPSFVDDSGELELLMADAVPLTGIPWTVIIDRDGLIAARVLGPTTFSELTDLVDQVASES